MRHKVAALVSKQHVRYLITGGTSYVLEYSVFLLVMWLTGRLFVANSTSFLCGFAVSFALHRAWSFSGNHAHKPHHQFGGYALLAGINLVFTNVLIGTLVRGVGLRPALAKVIVMTCIVAWNYIVLSRIVFRKHQVDDVL